MAESSPAPSGNGSGKATREEKVVQAEALKKEGNDHFRAGRIKDALRCYHHAMMWVRGKSESAAAFTGGGMNEDPKDDIRQPLRVSLHLNLAACYVKQEKWAKAVAACSKVIETNADHAKALYRRGQSYLRLKDVDRASQDLQKAAQLAPTDAAIKRELKLLARESAKQDTRQKAAYRKMFQ